MRLELKDDALFRALAQRYNMPVELATDLATLALYDIVIFAGERNTHVRAPQSPQPWCKWPGSGTGACSLACCSLRVSLAQSHLEWLMPNLCLICRRLGVDGVRGERRAHQRPQAHPGARRRGAPVLCLLSDPPVHFKEHVPSVVPPVVPSVVPSVDPVCAWHSPMAQCGNAQKVWSTGVRIKDCGREPSILVEQVATLFDDNGINIRFMNSNTEGNNVRDSVTAASIAQQARLPLHVQIPFDCMAEQAA